MFSNIICNNLESGTDIYFMSIHKKKTAAIKQIIIVYFNAGPCVYKKKHDFYLASNKRACASRYFL